MWIVVCLGVQFFIVHISLFRKGGGRGGRGDRGDGNLSTMRIHRHISSRSNRPQTRRLVGVIGEWTLNLNGRDTLFFCCNFCSKVGRDQGVRLGNFTVKRFTHVIPHFTSNEHVLRFGKERPGSVDERWRRLVRLGSTRVERRSLNTGCSRLNRREVCLWSRKDDFKYDHLSRRFIIVVGRGKFDNLRG